MMREFLNSPFWEYLTIAAVLIGLVAAVAFVIRYQYEVGFSWWRQPNGKPNHFGRFLMIRKVLLATLFLVVLANRFFPEWPARGMVTAVLMAAFALQTFVPYRLLISAQKAHETQEVRE